MDKDLARFVREHTSLKPVPFVPEVRLGLAESVYPLWEITSDDLAATSLPFWAFPWAGGQALARYVLDHPGLVRGRRVLDLASASGLVAIAAALAGGQVTASEIDPLAQAAVSVNAAANGVALAVTGDLLDQIDCPFDVLLAGDVFYELEMSQRVLPFLRRSHEAGARVLIGDPKRHYLPYGEVTPIASYQVEVVSELENARVAEAAVWTFTQSRR